MNDRERPTPRCPPGDAALKYASVLAGLYTLSARPSSHADYFEQLARFLYRSIVFQQPERTVDPPSWLEHIPFAFWIVEALRPAVFVELGTQSGNSYSGFAQAVQTLGLSTACYAIDTWQGDPQAASTMKACMQRVVGVPR
jgi:hypothetical protein